MKRFYTIDDEIKKYLFKISQIREDCDNKSYDCKCHEYITIDYIKDKFNVNFFIAYDVLQELKNIGYISEDNVILCHQSTIDVFIKEFLKNN